MSSSNITFRVFEDETFYDYSDYVVGIDPVPMIDRNRDFEPIVSEFNMTVTRALSALAKGQDVVIYKQSNIIFTGYIDSIRTNYADDTYEVRILSHLALLQNYYVDYTTLHSDLVGNASSIEEYCPAAADFEGYESVQCLYLIKRMFAIAGLEIFWTEIENTVLFNFTKSGKLEDYKAEDIRIDEFVLYAINQSRVYKYDDDPANTYEHEPSQKITFFDFLKIFCSVTGLFLAPRALKRYLFYHSTLGNYTVSDDYKWGYSSEEIDAREVDYNFIMNFAVQDANWRSGYHSKGGAFPIEQINQGTGNNLIDWYDNLFFLLKENWKVNITNATYSAGYVTIYVDDVVTYYEEEGFYILVEDVVGMTDLNGIHKIIETDWTNKWIKVQLTTAQSYTSGGTVRHAGSSWYGYWNPNEVGNGDTESSGLKYKKRVLLNSYTEEQIETAITVDKYAAVRNHINPVDDTSIILQETYV